MSTPKCPSLVVVLALASTSVLAEGPGLGKLTDPVEIAAWDISILPDGTGLPPGSGTSAQGARIYAQKCAMCHGENGKGGPFAAVVGGRPLTDGIDTVKTIANFWVIPRLSSTSSVARCPGSNLGRSRTTKSTR